MPPVTPAAREARADWAKVVVPSAVLLALVDGVLVQLARDFFTGGFLATDSATTWGDRALYAVVALTTDLTYAGLLAGLVFALVGTRASRVVRALLAAVVVLVPAAIVNIVNYELVKRLGDAFDLALMFELAGRNPAELLAVSYAHLLPMAGVALVGLVVAIAGLRWAGRRWPQRPLVTPGPRFLAGLAVLAVAGMGVLAAARSSSDTLDNGLRRKPSGKALGAVIQAVSDVDGDGYGLLSRMPDPAPFDGRIYPYAPDLPGNGIDENGVAGDLPEGPPWKEPDPPTAPFARRPDVVLFFLESFRADAVGAQVRGRAVTPFFDSLAEGGVSVPRAFSHNGYTVQSRYHLMSGRLVPRSGSDTLVDDFRRNGYEVAYFSAQDESFGPERYRVGFDRADVAYDARQDVARRYTTFTTAGALGVPADVLLERVGQFLARRDAKRPLFMIVGLYDTHFPYWHAGMQPLVSTTRVEQRDIAPGTGARLREMYLNSAANVDAAAGRLVDGLRAHLGREPAVIVTADHGESLYEGGFLGHGYALDDVQTRVPLIVANLPAVLPGVMGHADLRWVMLEALEGRTGEGPPRLERVPGRRVFQYLGVVERPAAIAFAGEQGRLTYDFRARTVEEDGAIVSEAALDDGAAARWRELVHFWERLVLAWAETAGELSHAGEGR